MALTPSVCTRSACPQCDATFTRVCPASFFQDLWRTDPLQTDALRRHQKSRYEPNLSHHFFNTSLKSLDTPGIMASSLKLRAPERRNQLMARQLPPVQSPRAPRVPHQRRATANLRARGILRHPTRLLAVQVQDHRAITGSTPYLHVNESSYRC